MSGLPEKTKRAKMLVSSGGILAATGGILFVLGLLDSERSLYIALGLCCIASGIAAVVIGRRAVGKDGQP